MEGYKSNIVNCSKELSKKEKVMLKDLGNAIAIDSQLESDDDSLVITPAYYAEIQIDNERSKGDKHYNKFVVVDTAGNKFVTGSQSFITSFLDIWSEMEGEEFSVSVYRKSSRNYNGKYFITCSLCG